MGLFDGALGSAGFARARTSRSSTQAPVPRRQLRRGLDGASPPSSTAAGPRARGPGRRRHLNNVASPRHEAEARAGVEATGIPVVGAIPRLPDVVVPSSSRAIPAAERRPEALSAVEALSRMARDYLDLDLVLAIAGEAPDLETDPWDPVEAVGCSAGDATDDPAGTGPVVAVAAGEAFTFGYAETSSSRAPPVRGSRPSTPCATRTCRSARPRSRRRRRVPEIHASALAANRPLRAAIAQFAADGGPIAAECAGLLYLCQELDGAPMCGVLPATAQMHPRLVLGYRHAWSP